MIYILYIMLELIIVSIISFIIGYELGFNFECAVIYLLVDASFGRHYIRKDIEDLKYEIQKKL